jgi:signal transduction histidine kinase
MRRLYWRIYAGFVLVLILFALMVGMLRLLGAGEDRSALVEGVAATLVDLLPAPEAPVAELEATLERLAARFRSDLTIYAADRRPLASSGAPVPRPPQDGVSGWVHDERGHAFALLLPDGRWLVAHRSRAGARSGAWVVLLAVLALAIALGAYPLARRITRRLEQLQDQVEALGAGDLSARVQVQGRDEVAELARAFNRSAARIEELLRAQRSTLAGASHELRSPLTRIRMALELSDDGLRPDLRRRVEHDIAELDELIEELLLASRLQSDSAPGPGQVEEVDLLALLAEEGSRVGAAVSGEPVVFAGDPRLLRRMLRNLLENAARHGGGTPIEAAVLRDEAGTVLVTVEDRGPGIAPEVRERIFEPFFRPPGMREHRDPGVGLGLSLVRDIARHHRGSVDCEDRDGGGTTLRLSFPTANQKGT